VTKLVILWAGPASSRWGLDFGDVLESLSHWYRDRAAV